MTVWCRGVRGAITVAENTREAVLSATKELLQQIIDANGIDAEDVASVFFTATPDLDAEFPAVAAREIGWNQPALMCAQEMYVPGGMQRCIRILIHWNTTKQSSELVHVYLRDAQRLRPELVKKEETE